MHTEQKKTQDAKTLFLELFVFCAAQQKLDETKSPGFENNIRALTNANFENATNAKARAGLQRMRQLSMARRPAFLEKKQVGIIMRQAFLIFEARLQQTRQLGLIRKQARPILEAGASRSE